MHEFAKLIFAKENSIIGPISFLFPGYFVQQMQYHSITNSNNRYGRNPNQYWLLIIDYLFCVTCDT